MEARGQNVLQKTADKLMGIKSHGLPRRVADAFVAEYNPPLIDRNDAAVGDRHAMYVASEVRKNSIGSLDGGFGVDDPVLVPDRLG